MPWDSRAQRESSELGNEAADTRVALGAAYDRTQRRLGFGVGAGDPYSAVEENKRRLTSNQRGIGTTAGKQLYSGSTLNARSQARRGYDKTQKGLEEELAEAQADYARGTAQTTRDEQLGGTGIKEGALERAAATTPKPLGVGRGRGRNARKPSRGRGRI